MHFLFGSRALPGGASKTVTSHCRVEICAKKVWVNNLEKVPESVPSISSPSVKVYRRTAAWRKSFRISPSSVGNRGARQPGDARGCVASADQESSNPEDRSCSCPSKRDQCVTLGWGCRSRLEDAFEETFSCFQTFPIVPKETGWFEVGVKHSFGKSI